MKLTKKPKATSRSTRRAYASGMWTLLAITLAVLSHPGARIGAQSGNPCAAPLGNPIVCENQQPGAPASEWDVVGAGDASIQGFAADISVNRGGTLKFKIDTNATNYRLDIYRMGYYGGFGARKVATLNPSVALPQLQPACLMEPATGLVDCGNWKTSAVWEVPDDAVSGIYFARAVRLDTGGASHILFVVRDDGRRSDLLFQTSDTTWQAYNQYGGNSLYFGAPDGRAYKVSYNRPVTVRGTAPEDSVFNAEYPMVRWMEANGFDVAYFSGLDTDRRGSELLLHKAFLSVGHDEYWSGAQRAQVEAARAAGVNLAFFSGNEVFWKTRWEPSISADGTQYRTLVTYKETHANAKIDPSAAWTGTWRDPRFSPAADGGRPENALTGTIFTVNSGTSAIQVPAAAGQHRFWRNTAAATLAPGAVLTLPQGTLGYEWDEDLDNGFRPAGLVRLSDTTVTGVSYLQDFGSTYAPGTANHALTLYRHPSGALVFGAGTVQWSWGLDGNHERGESTPSIEMQQATVNLFADMGAQPLTLQPGLTSTGPSTDVLPPTSSITSPAQGSQVDAGTVVTIAGVAADAGGGSIGGVEVSVDGGTTWRRAAGRNAWTFSWSTGSVKDVVVVSRAVDDNGNMEQPSAGVLLHVVPRTCPCTVWSASQGPAGPATQDLGLVELGMRFRADVSGFVTGIRFFKPVENTGTHIGSLWTATGTRLSTVTFSAESASGWQQVTLPTPIAIAANTTYVVSYNTGSGFYAGDSVFFAANGVDADPLHAPSSVSDPNGVFLYGPSQFPTQPSLGANYWVDVVFVGTIAPDTTAPTVSLVTPASGQADVASGAPITVTFSENVQQISAATFELTEAGQPAAAATVAYSAANRTATLTTGGGLAFGTSYTARVRGGPAGVTDMAGTPLATDYVWTFTTAPAPPPPPDSGPGGPVLIVSSSARPFSKYYAELLRAEGLNDFVMTDISALTPAKLATAQVVLLGEVAVNSTEISILSAWVATGGKLIAMRPDKKLAGLLGLASAGGTLSEGYLRVDTTQAPGSGIVDATMQFHGAADLYTLAGATAVATLFTDAATPTTAPAVTMRSVGTGGQAAAFAYDLARSVVTTRQGNPAWSGLERDATGPIRSNDLFFGGSEPDRVNLDKVAIPQADEQQRLLANMILNMVAAARPLPRFWYFPRGEKAVVVMTGDDHGNNGTEGRFDVYKGNSPVNCSVNDWECVRATSYIYPTTPIGSLQASAFAAEGFEIAVHVSTGCRDYNSASIQLNYASQLSQFRELFPNLPAVVSNRTHCVPWSDYDTQPQVEWSNGIRLDTNYYYYPGSWVQDRPGFMTGSGMPMRFAKADGTLVDVYQAATQMTDESNQSWPFTVDTLLDRAIGPEGYYGFFVANMHTDTVEHAGSEAIVASALARSIPVISASQLLTWLDGRNASSHAGQSWVGDTLHFTVTTDVRANGLQTLLPAVAAHRRIASVTRDGQTVAFTIQTLKGIDYAVFNSPAGVYDAVYALDETGPAISGVTIQPDFRDATISWTTDEVANGRVDYGTDPDELTGTVASAAVGTAHSVQLTGLAAGTTYYYRVVATDVIGNTSAAPAVILPPGNFQTLAYTCPCTIWTPAQAPAQPSADDPAAIEVGLKFKPFIDGYATAVRFYKGPQNTGAHVGNLWSTNGTRLATVTFTNETATGWQEATLFPAVALSANTTYVVSYHTTSGGYAADLGYFQSAGVTRGPLQALADGVSGSNGVFGYGPTAFPSQSFAGANYWVDVVFSTVAPPPPPQPISFTDTTAADFEAGVVDAGAFVSRITNGEVTLAPVLETFSGSTVPAGWSSTPWNAGGASTVASGNTTVDGALLIEAAARQPDQSLEFVATFSGDAFQHGGFAPAVQDRWAMFSTGAGSGGLVARSFDGSTSLETVLPGALLNTPHRYRIEWSASSVTFSVDGAPAATHNLAIAGPMSAMFSDFAAGGGSLVVDSVQTEPYAVAGTFTSRVLDAGAPAQWTSAVSTTQVPAATSLSLSVRFGDTPVPDGSWSSFASIASGSATLDAASRYAQYQVALTGDGGTTSALQSFTIGGTIAGAGQAFPGGRFSKTAGRASVGAASAGAALSPTPSGVPGGSPSYVALSTGAAATPSLKIDDVSVTETDGETVPATFTVTLSAPSDQAVTVEYRSVDGSATAPADYTAVTGTLTFAAGVTTQQIVVLVSGDTLAEATETYQIILSGATNATIKTAKGSGTIVDNDPPAISIENRTGGGKQ